MHLKNADANDRDPRLKHRRYLEQVGYSCCSLLMPLWVVIRPAESMVLGMMV